MTQLKIQNFATKEYVDTEIDELNIYKYATTEYVNSVKDYADEEFLHVGEEISLKETPLSFIEKYVMFITPPNASYSIWYESATSPDVDFDLAYNKGLVNG